MEPLRHLHPAALSPEELKKLREAYGGHFIRSLYAARQALVEAIHEVDVAVATYQRIEEERR